MWATIFRDGHESLGAAVLYRPPGCRDVAARRRCVPPGTIAGRDPSRVDAPGRWEFTVQAWVDRFESFRDELRRKVEAGQTDLDSELQEGALLFGVPMLDVETALSSTEADRSEATRLVRTARRGRRPRACALRRLVRALPAIVGRVRRGRAGVARAGRAGLRRRLPAADPPDRRHEPQGAATTRWRPAPDDPGSPWAIGSEQGGHTAIDPGLGTIEDFARLVAAGRTPWRRDRARLRDPVLARPSLAEASIRSGSTAVPTGRSSTRRTRRSATRTSTTSTSTAPTGRGCGRRSATSSCTGSGTACRCSASTTRTRSRCRSGSG